MINLSSWQEWSNRSLDGKVCGMLGCSQDPKNKCPHCNHFYYLEHIKIHLCKSDD